MGNLVFQAALGGQVALSGPNTASSFTVAVPAVSGTMVTTGDTGTVTSTMISGPLTAAVGGTGVNNGSNTLSLAGNVSHTGAYTQTIAATANTSVTLPTSGTIISSSTALGGAVTGTPSSSTYLRGDATWASLSAVTTFSAGTTGFTPSSATSGAVTLAGTLGIANGGTGLSTTPTNGQLLIGNGTNYTAAALTAGSNVTITNGSGSITIAASSSPPTTYGAIGTYIIGGTSGASTAGSTTVSGSSFRLPQYGTISMNAQQGGTDSNSLQFFDYGSTTYAMSLSGTWLAMTNCTEIYGVNYNLWLRIS
jgi:hypothetical protein